MSDTPADERADQGLDRAIAHETEPDDAVDAEDPESPDPA